MAPVTTATIPSIPVWRDLHRCICGPDYSGAQLPTWPYRIADDLVMSVKPQPAHWPNESQIKGGIEPRAIRFQCRAVTVESGVANAAMLVAPVYGFDNCRWWRRKFEVYGESETSTSWHLSPREGEHAYFELDLVEDDAA